ncbi:MAG: primase alpha helix C-terminal domain-containing protein [Actinomycetota bacterium]|jgi:hypothetical protein|nr:primase alpha helix C-terminal domain-containing protein [Actinomycetota bacterium]
MVPHEDHEDLHQKAKQYMDLLHHELAAEERIEIRYRGINGGDNSMRQEFFSITVESASRAVDLGQTAEVYMGVATRLGEDGTKSGVIRTWALWGDFDLKGSYTRKGRATQMKSLPCRPSMIVWSGNGYHAYWLLEEPAESKEDLETAERVMGLLAAGLEGDPVQDRSRILRVPGTFNHKYDEPQTVLLKRCKPDARYSLDQILEMAKALPKISKSAIESVSGVQRDVLNAPISEGNRNAVLASVAGSLRSRGLASETICVVLLEVNRLRCDPPLEESEVLSVGKAISKYPAGEPRYRRPSASRVYWKDAR